MIAIVALVAGNQLASHNIVAESGLTVVIWLGRVEGTVRKIVDREFRFDERWRRRDERLCSENSGTS